MTEKLLEEEEEEVKLLEWQRSLYKDRLLEEMEVNSPATFASIILSSPLEEKAEEEDADPLLGNWTRRVVGSVQWVWEWVWEWVESWYESEDVGVESDSLCGSECGERVWEWEWGLKWEGGSGGNRRVGYQMWGG